jgi:hypothetical protein
MRQLWPPGPHGSSRSLSSPLLRLVASLARFEAVMKRAPRSERFLGVEPHGLAISHMDRGIIPSNVDRPFVGVGPVPRSQTKVFHAPPNRARSAIRPRLEQPRHHDRCRGRAHLRERA